MENPSGGERPGGETPRPERSGTGGAVGGPGAEEATGPRADGREPGEAEQRRDGAPSAPVPPRPGPAADSTPRVPAPPHPGPGADSTPSAPAAPHAERTGNTARHPVPPRPGPGAGAPPYRTAPPSPGMTQAGAPYGPVLPAALYGHPVHPGAGYGPPVTGPVPAPHPWRAPAAHTHPHPFSLPPGGHPAAHPGMGWQPPAPPWTQPPGRPSRRGGASVLLGSASAAAIALVALAASILIVATTPQEEPQPTGVDLSAHYDDRLRARPNQVEVDVVDHPLYDVAMPAPVDCDVPELDMDSDESWEEFASVSGECLNRLWEPVFEDLGVSVELPEFAVTRTSPDPPDASPEDGYTLAYYESDLSRVTVVLPNVRHLGALLPPDEREEVWLALMGHEYGHHVQYATGILGVAHGMTWKAENEQAELEALRRTELQAECMAGVGLRGITGADEGALRTANEHFNGGGDLDTHGTAGNRALWLERGWSQETVEGCNTYGAATDQVA